MASTAVQKFFSNIGIADVHQSYHKLNLNQMDHTEVRGSKLIDTIAASHGIMEYVEGSILLEYNELIFTDHRAYIVDLNLEDYFEDQLSKWD